MLGQPVGGWFADWNTKKFGVNWGRIMPLSTSGILAGAAYTGCLFVDSAWEIIACCAVVSFAVGMGNPAIWALFQDIGGRITAATFGWGNMWANLGAASISMLVPWLVATGTTSEEGQRHVFMVCAGALFLSAVVALGLDASKPLLPETRRSG
jgi:MFS transporter, ACS family, glucarate transporter